MATDFHVFIEKVDAIELHPNADKMEFAVIKGWRCLVPKGEFVVGENVIFVQPDSILPKEFMDRFEIKYLKHGGRVGIVKLRGEYSQGLVLKNTDNYKRGTDVAEYYGIKKWEPEVKGDPLMRKSDVKSRKKAHVDFLKYTSIERLQQHPDVIGPDEFVVLTEKIHGMNFRAGWVKENKQPRTTLLWRKVKKMFGKANPRDGYEFAVGSHNVENPQQKVFHEVAERNDLKNKIPNGYILYGEVYGPGIQPGFDYGLTNPDVVFFDLSDPNGRYLDWPDFANWIKNVELQYVPILDICTFQDVVYGYAEGESYLCMYNIVGREMGKVKRADTPEPHMREGFVIRLEKERSEPGLGRVILKVVGNQYLEAKTKEEIVEVADE